MALQPCKECNKEISTDAKVCPHCGKKVGMGAGRGCLLVFLVFIGLGVLTNTFHNSETGGVSTTDPKSPALSQVSLDFKWRTKGFGNIMEADFTIKNNSNYNIKDLEIRCRHSAKSGTEIDSNTRTIYDVI